ncbi:hypothetical protein [Prosthecochloris sp. CIB 2401]|uniref:hypothetical protein n=1 Tax=Prosthecochloris sp. CIB 2401 TaxID=1868325 RepID=UPI001F33FF91|nr:hypothetical protein [Prosthecochloris sp. CIB 2401]
MSTLLVPLIACAAVILCVLLLNQVWTLFFDSRTKAKKERLQTIHNTVHWGGKRPGIAQATLQESIVETWLRSHSRTYRQFENLVQRAHSQLSAVCRSSGFRGKPENGARLSKTSSRKRLTTSRAHYVPATALPQPLAW